MKKNLFIAALAFVAMGANAQVVNTLDGYQAGDQFEKDGVKYELIAVEEGNPVKVVGAVAEEVTVQEAFAFEGGDNYTVTDFTAGLAQMDLTKVSAVADEPMAIADDFFTEATYEDGELVVETNSICKYANATGWMNFFTITDGTIIYGDINGDGEVDIKDLAALKAYVIDEEDVVNEVLTDANGDGEIDIRDLARMKSYLFD